MCNITMQEIANTLDCMHDQQFVVGQTAENISGGGIAATLDASYYKGTGSRNGKEREIVAVEQEPVVYPGVGITSVENASNPELGDPAPTLSTDSRNYLVKKKLKYIVRRLTPTECLRLQGLPDWWCEGANGSDSAIYKMAGNGLAIPCAEDVLRRIAEELENNRNERT